MNDRFLRACRGEEVDATPVWFMRQAGRHLAGYRELREKHAILEIARSPKLASQVCLMPVRELDVDAAILFADIMLPIQAMGVDLDIVEHVGPVMAHPVETPEDVEKLEPFDPAKMAFLGETIERVKAKLGGVPLIGFSGAPFTLASYLIEGRPSRDFLKTKTFMWRQPDAWSSLLEHLGTAMASYLRMQTDAGAEAIQLFDTWVGCLDPTAYRASVLPHVKRIFDDLRDLDVPTIHFGTNTASLLPAMKEAGGSVMSVDWRIPIDDAWHAIGEDRAIQGNLDPAALLVGGDVLDAQIRDILRRIDGRPGHIFNLGHGILPTTPPDAARGLVEKVRAWSGKGG